MAFEPLQTILRPSYDAMFPEFVQGKIDYLLNTDESKIITVEIIKNGLDAFHREYFRKQLCSDWYKIITGLAKYATSDGRNIDELFENKQILNDFIEYLNVANVEIRKRVGGRGCAEDKQYILVEGMVYSRITMVPLTQNDLLILYMNKNFTDVLLEYSEKIFENIRTKK